MASTWASKVGGLIMASKDLLATRLQRAAQHRAHRWGYQLNPELETALTAKIYEGINKIEGQSDLNDEFEISRFEANLSVLVDEMVSQARVSQARGERVIGELSPRLLEDSLRICRASFWPFD